MKLRARLVLSLLAGLAFAAPALAHDNGEGLVGETDDRIITFFSFGVILFLIAVVSIGSWLQTRLEKRKQEQEGSELRQRIGW